MSDSAGIVLFELLKYTDCLQLTFEFSCAVVLSEHLLLYIHVSYYAELKQKPLEHSSTAAFRFDTTNYSITFENNIFSIVS